MIHLHAARRMMVASFIGVGLQLKDRARDIRDSAKPLNEC